MSEPVTEAPVVALEPTTPRWTAIEAWVEPGTWRTVGVLEFDEGKVADDAYVVAGLVGEDQALPVEAKDAVRLWCPAVATGWLPFSQFRAALAQTRLTGKVPVWAKNDFARRIQVVLRVRHRGGRDEALAPDATAAYYGSQVWKRTTYLGVPVLKHPCDLWAMQEILHDVRPDIVIETGTFMGGSAKFLNDVLRQIDDRARVVTIDVEDKMHPLTVNDVVHLNGSSVNPEILDIVGDIARGKRVLVTLDSDHSYDHVLAELRAYAPLVSQGSYLVVEDCNTPGPAEAVKDFLASPEGASFEADLAREKYGTTFNPGGFLRRGGK